MTETDPEVGADGPAPPRRRVRVKRRLGVTASSAPATSEADRKLDAPEPPPPQRRRSARPRGETPATSESESDPEVAADEPHSPRGKHRVRRRVARPFHLSRTRQQILTALVIAVIAATAVAWFLGASLEDPEAYIPGGAIH
jgi:hypothetical protein